MTAFWIMAALLTALAGLSALSGARRGADPDEAVSISAELAELDRLKSRGLLDEAGWAAARAEAGRRILVSDREAEPVWVGPADRFWVLAALAATAAATLGLYALIATPGLPDQAYEDRVDQWLTELDTLAPPQLAAVAARVVKERPDDQQALTMLGAARFEAGDPIGAASAFRRALSLMPDDASNWSRLGESLTRANGGVVGGDAEAAFTEALRRDPGQLGARYFLGEAALARGEPARVREMWGPLIAALDPADPRRADLQQRMPGGTDQ